MGLKRAYIISVVLYYAAIVAFAAWFVKPKPDSRCYRAGDSKEWEKYCMKSGLVWKRLP